MLEISQIPLLSAYSHDFQAEEDLIEIQTTDILVSELSEVMSATLRYVTYPIFKEYTWC